MIDGGAMCPHYYCHSPGPGPPITRSVFINNQNTSLHHMFLGIAVLMLVSALASLVWYQDYRQWETTVERPMRLQQCPRVRPCLSLLINISLLFLLLGSHPLWWLLQPSQEEITTCFSEVTKFTLWVAALMAQGQESRDNFLLVINTNFKPYAW